MKNDVTLDAFLKRESSAEKTSDQKVETLPQLPEGWKWARLRNLGKYINGRAFKQEEWETSGLPIIRIQNLTNTNAPFNYCSKPVEPKYCVHTGDLLISWSATLDAFIWSGGDAVLNQHIFRVEINEKLVDKKFLFYAIKYILEEMKRKIHGSTMKHITKGKFENTEIPLPSLDVQRRVVARIEEIMSRVEQAKKLREEALKDAEAIMQSALQQIFLGVEARKWEWKTLGDVIKSVRYGISKKANTEGKGYPIIRMINIKDGKIDYSDLKFVELDEKEASKYFLKVGDILINRTNSFELVGKSGIFDKKETYVFASYLIRLEIDETYAEPRFINLTINSKIGRDYVSKTCRRAINQANINAKEIKKMPIPLPPLEEQKRIVAYLDALQKEVEVLTKLQEETGEKIETMTRTILRRAFNGEL
jgi:type I restriction enzyme S subunit